MLKKSGFMPKYSIIVPVFNRPDEVDELLASLTQQSYHDFEVVLVEDGSSKPCKEVADRYAPGLDLHYYSKENSGPGPSRNYGVERAHGEYVIILDSDVVLPEGYLAAVDRSLKEHPCDAFGGPDRAHESFTDMQKAISYSMTSFFTTGGIRGGKAKLDKFHPRSYNLGVKREVYNALGGFSKMRFGEDIDFSYRILESGYTTRLYPDAWVWHKRRTNLDKFFKQVFNSGIARINLTKRHPGTLKLVHLLPMVFTIGVICLILAAVVMRLAALSPSASECFREGFPLGKTHIGWWTLPLLPIILYILLVFIDSTIRNRSAVIGYLSIKSSFVQLFGYGFGFLTAWWKRCVLRKSEFSAFEKNFY